jgi:integrase
MTVEQSALLLKAAAEADGFIGCYTALSLLSGMRTEEARELTWDHVDLVQAPCSSTTPSARPATPRPRSRAAGWRCRRSR